MIESFIKVTRTRREFVYDDTSTFGCVIMLRDPFFGVAIKIILDLSGHRNRYTHMYTVHMLCVVGHCYSDLSVPVLSHPPRVSVSSPHQAVSTESDSESTTVAENTMNALVREDKAPPPKVNRAKTEGLYTGHNERSIRGRQTRVCL